MFPGLRSEIEELDSRLTFTTPLLPATRVAAGPAVTVPPLGCDIHHVLEWDTDDGPTNPENGGMLCRRHHRMLHAGRGYSAKLLPDGTLEITYPDGHVESSRSRGTTTQPFW